MYIVNRLIEAFQNSDTVWMLIGFAAQGLFSGRFVVQWLYSEKHKKSLIPVTFWWFSIAGGASLFAYAWHRNDPVFIFGQGLGLIIYVRNLFLIRREKREHGVVSSAAPSSPAAAASEPR